MAQTFTLEEMGQKLKTSNPGKFDGFSNSQLANFYLEAKPQAKSIVLNENTAVGVAKGVGKSVLGTVKESSGLGEKILGSLGKTLLPKGVERAIGIDKAPDLGILRGLGVKPQEQQKRTGADQFQQTVEQSLDIVPGSLTEARTDAQKVGKVGGDIAQFFVPGGAAARAGKVNKAIQQSRGAGKLTQFGARIAPQVAADIGVGTLQTGSPVEGLKVGALSAALPIAGAGLSKVKRAIPTPSATKTSERIINSLVKPLKRFESYGKNPARGVVSEGIVFNTLEEGATKIGARRDSLVGELQNVLRQPKYANQAIDLTDIPQIFDDAIDFAAKANDTATFNKLSEAKQAITERLVNIEGKITSQGKRNLVMNPEESILLKREVGKMRTWTGITAEEKARNKALLDVYRKINNKVNAVVPEAEVLNRRISDLSSAEEAIIYREQIASRSNILPLATRVTGVASLIAGAATMNPVLIAIAFADFGIDAALSSPAFKTRLAQFLSKAGKAERKSLYESVPALRPVLDRIFTGDTPKTTTVIKKELDNFSDVIPKKTNLGNK